MAIKVLDLDTDEDDIQGDLNSNQILNECFRYTKGNFNFSSM